MKYRLIIKKAFGFIKKLGVNLNQLEFLDKYVC
jgi:hypothetical protein